MVESLLSAAPDRAHAYFYRTAAGAEINPVLDMSGEELWAIEIKRGLEPKLKKGGHHARKDLKPTRSYIVHSGEDRFPKAEHVEAIGVLGLSKELSSF